MMSGSGPGRASPEVSPGLHRHSSPPPSGQQVLTCPWRFTGSSAARTGAGRASGGRASRPGCPRPNAGDGPQRKTRARGPAELRAVCRAAVLCRKLGGQDKDQRTQERGLTHGPSCQTLTQVAGCVSPGLCSPLPFPPKRRAGVPPKALIHAPHQHGERPFRRALSGRNSTTPWLMPMAGGPTLPSPRATRPGSRLPRAGNGGRLG